MQELDSNEKNKILQLRQEHDAVSTKLDWMYGNPHHVDNEDYLLGKAVDSKNHVEHECIPPSIRDLHGTDDDQVDIAKKLQEDPLVEIHRRQIEARKKMLQNPIKLKEMLKMTQKKVDSDDHHISVTDKFKILKNMESSSEDGSSSDEDLNKKLMEKLKQLKKLKQKTKKKKKRKKSEKESKSGRREKNKNTKHDSSSEDSDSDDKLVKKSTKNDKSKKKRKSNDNSDDSEQPSKKRKEYKSDGERKIKKPRSSSNDSGYDKNKKRSKSSKKSKSPDKHNSQRKHTKESTTANHKKRSYSQEREKQYEKYRNPSNFKEREFKHVSKRNLDESTSESNSYGKRRTKPSLTEDEKARKRQEMMENAQWKEKNRPKYVKRDEEKELLKNYKEDPEFLKKYLLKSTDIGSVEARIKSNINNIQRRKTDMDSNFARR